MRRVKRVFESLIRRLCRIPAAGLSFAGRTGRLLKSPAIFLLIAVYLITCVPNPQYLAYASETITVEGSEASGDSVQTQSVEKSDDSDEESSDSNGGFQTDGSGNENSDTDQSVHDDSEDNMSDQDNSSSDNESNKDNESYNNDSAGSGSENDTSASDQSGVDNNNNNNQSGSGQSDHNGETTNQSGDNHSGKDHNNKDKNGKDQTVEAGSGSTEVNAGASGELVYRKSTRASSYTIKVTGDKDSGIHKVASMNVLEVNKNDSIYADSVKKLNKSLIKGRDGVVKNIHLYHIMFCDKDGKHVTLDGKVDVKITYREKSALKLDKNDKRSAVRAFSIITSGDRDAEGVARHIDRVNKEEEEKGHSSTSADISVASLKNAATTINNLTQHEDEPIITIMKANWTPEKYITSKIIRSRVREISYSLRKDGLTGIAITGTEEESTEKKKTETKPETTESDSKDDKEKDNSDNDPNNTDKSTEATTEAAPETATEATTEAAPETTTEATTEAAPETATEATTEEKSETEAGKDKQHSLTATDGNSNVVLSYNDDANIPEGATLSVKEIKRGTEEYSAYINQTESVYPEKEDASIKTARFFDIKILDKDGNEIEPAAPVSVNINFNPMSVEYKDTVDLIHFEEGKKKDETKPEIIQGVNVHNGGRRETIDGVDFEAENFSVYGVVSTILTKTLKASDGKTYTVKVTFDNTCGIPDNAELSVTEIKQGEAGYDEYVAKTAEELGTKPENIDFARAFDIKLVDPETGEKYEPTKNVKVSIELSEKVNEEKKVSVVHFKDDVSGGSDDKELSDQQKEAIKNAETEVLDNSIVERSVEFTADNFSVYVVTGYTVDFHWGDYTWTIEGEGSINLSDLLKELKVTEITIDDVTEVTFSNPEYLAVELAESDWLLRSLAPFTTEESLNLQLSNGQIVAIKVTDEQGDHNPKIGTAQGVYNQETGTITYTVTVEADGESGVNSNPVIISDMTVAENSGLTFESGTYKITYAGNTDPAAAEGASKRKVNKTDVEPSNEGTDFSEFPLKVTNMYDGDTITLSYTAKVNNVKSWDKESKKAEVENTISIDCGETSGNVQDDDTKTVTTSFDYPVLEKELYNLDGSWASWEIKVNQAGFKLNGGEKLTLKDTFSDNQSIDYASIRTTNGVSYDYSGRTGTYVIPDKTPVTITYRTRITAEPGQNAHFDNTAVLRDSSDKQIASVTKEEEHIIYPSASDVATTTGKYMVKMFVYEDGKMQTGIPGAEFILLDANGRPLTYKKGDNAGQEIKFVTGDNGYVNIELDEEECGLAIQKNTEYNLEMIKAPEGYKKDNTLYNFMITDDPGYDSGGVWTYYNGDTMKVRLYPESASLNVTMRFSGNCKVPEAPQNDIKVILQKKDGDNWITVEEHTYSEFSYGSMTFENGSSAHPFEVGSVYRVIQEGQNPWWDTSGEVVLKSTYYLIKGSESSEGQPEPVEFTVTEADSNSSFNAVINNEYEIHELSITKMNKENGKKLPGAVFTVYTAKDNSEITTYTTNTDGKIVIKGNESYVKDVLYYVVETSPPAGYLLPLIPENTYFYFNDDPDVIPDILKDLPEGETAINLLEDYDSLTVDNQPEKRTIAVMKTWQGYNWPDGIDHVEVGLYQSVDKEEPVPVKDESDTPRTVVLTKEAPYNNRAFTDLPARNADNKTINYSIKEEHIYQDAAGTVDVKNRYVQEYGISDAGVYIVRNREAASLTVSKKWYDGKTKVDDEETLSKQSDVTFDIYQSTSRISEEISGDITNQQLESLLGSMTKIRSDFSFGHGDSWTKTVDDLPKQDDLGNKYYYYAHETIPSFGDEVYQVNEDEGTVTIKNQLPPAVAKVKVKLNRLENDPRPDVDQQDFHFTLKLYNDRHNIRGYTVAEGMKPTDENGEVTFTLQPNQENQEKEFTLPKGVTAKVTEAAVAEYTVRTKYDGVTVSGNIISFSVNDNADDKTVEFTNTLRVVCKVAVVDEDDKPFESIKSALAFIRDTTSHTVVRDKDGYVSIQMIKDYVMPASDIFDVQETEKIILTTATTVPDDPLHFETDRTGEHADTALITRGTITGSMITNTGDLKLEKVILDGNKSDTTAECDGGIVNNSGTLSLSDDTILQNSSVSGKGGAVYTSGTVKMSGSTITGNSAANGSAIYLEDGELTITGCSISNNIGAEDGAVAVYDVAAEIKLSGTVDIYNNKNDQDEQANIYLGADSDYVINVVNSGLNADSRIGVRPVEGHREIGEQFASAEFGFTNNLNVFINDLYDYRGKLREGTSENIVWDGLTLDIKKTVAERGANPEDRFKITLRSTSIKRSTYTITGHLDYVVTPAKSTTPGSIVFTDVKANEDIRITPLPAGSYTVIEEASNYDPTYSGEVNETHEALDLSEDDYTFTLKADSTVNVRNTRKLADVDLTKTLDDRLKESGETQNFDFTVKLTEADGSPVKRFKLAEGITTGDNGEVSFTMSPKTPSSDGQDNGADTRQFKAPVGAAMTITETPDPNYQITASAVIKSGEGEGTDITDENTDDDNIITFPVTVDGADVTFVNERKMAEIVLRKVLTNKVSKVENFNFDVTLIRADGHPAVNYTMYRDTQDSTKKITTDEDGKVVIPFEFGENEKSREITLTIPEGTKLEVEERLVRKVIDGEAKEIYDTSYSKNEQTAVTGRKAIIDEVSDDDHSIVFSNVRKTQTITVKNTVAGYSGNVVPFHYTATVTDGGDNDYDAHGFTNGEQIFDLTNGQSHDLIVPYGASLKVAETMIIHDDDTDKEIGVIGYETWIKRGNDDSIKQDEDEFDVKTNLQLAFTNNQLINLVLENNTSSELENVYVKIDDANVMYRVNDNHDGQNELKQDGESDTFNPSTHVATVSIAAGKTAILEVNHTAPSGTKIEEYEDPYTVTGSTRKNDYYYTINNEPSFHQYAEPAILRIYNADSFTLKGKLRYSVSDSTVTFSEQPLVSFDPNGGVWTTEMDDYHDRDSDSDKKVYQKAVDTGEKVSKPTEPVYPTEDGIKFLGWTRDEEFAKQKHVEGEDVSQHLYDFDLPVNEPITLYAIWSKDPSKRTVTVKNWMNSQLTISVILTENGSPVVDRELTEGITTNTSGQVSFTLDAKGFKNLDVPDGAKLVLTAPKGRGYSTDFTDGDTDESSFTINSADHDGTVSFIGGICKITDSDGKILYDNDGNPAVYWTLTAAFVAYTGNMYADAGKLSSATPAAVKILIDEYNTVDDPGSITFPNASMILTTAGKEDDDFPYVDNKTISAIYRSANLDDKNCFILNGSNSKITLTNIILDGGSERNRAIKKTINGGLISISNGELNVHSGTTMRNCKFNAYDDANNSRGGAIYITGGTLTINAGLFSNLHARRGGAIDANSNANLIISGSNGSIHFEDCSTNANNENNYGGDGGAIWYYSKLNNLQINGGENKEKPGIIFERCVAGSVYGDGGAVYSNTDVTKDVTVTNCKFIECSCKLDDKTKNDSGFGGGAICAKNVKSLSVSDCRFTDCDSMISGGAVMGWVKTDDAGVSVINCVFESCKCKAQGGGVAVYQNNKSASGSATRLLISGSRFSECSSGTNNGSGGAVQCYLPCMEYNNTTFADCWAGKEGGAVNNYFGGNYSEVWNNSSMTVTGCNFYRCRAEDRYDPTALQHYGGGINTKAKTVVVTDSYFEDCVSTLKEGGALHIGGQGGGSTATVTGSTFKNCSAKNGGGALLSSHETLEIGNCNFYGCSSSASNGGAVYHYRNSRGDSTQKNTSITRCTFSSDPDDTSETKTGCNAANNGGAIWTRATTDIQLTNLTIADCTAGSKGGGIYLETNTTEAKITDGSITGCQAPSGSAVYVGKKATFSSSASGELVISGNIVSDINDGAVRGGALYFERNVKVEDNTCSNDSTYDHDVLMQNNNVNIIYTSAVALDENAHIGVYVPETYFNKRGLEDTAFGTYGSTSYLDAFFNDRNDELFGYQKSNDSMIYWGTYVCKITDAEGHTLTRPNGRPAIYQRLTMALDEFKQVSGGDPVYIKMLIENYNIVQNETISNFPAADITLTTATKNDEPDGNKYPYRGTEGTYCTISRSNTTNQLFKLDNENATFRLKEITLDGRKTKTAAKGDFRLIEASKGALVVDSGTTMQYGYTGGGDGGAIYAASTASVTVNGFYDATKKEATVKFLHCYVSDQKNGGAICADNLTITNSSDNKGEYGTSFIDCKARRGGAVYTKGTAPNITGAEFLDCYAYNGGGAFYDDNESISASVSIINSAFTSCFTDNEQQYSNGGAINTKAGELLVNQCTFKDCRARANGGAINHGADKDNRDKTTINDCIFENCKTVSNSPNYTYGYGGSVYTRAKEVVIDSSSFNHSTAFNHGGTLYCECSSSGSSTTISGSSFENSSTTRDIGRGGAIYSRGKSLTLQKNSEGNTAINNCIATGSNSVSGAVYMETSGSNLNIKNATRISACYANKGGAIYLVSGVTMTLSGSPEFTKNGYTVLNGRNVETAEGACIYLEDGSTLNLSGSPKFSRNYFPYSPLITNGGVLDYKRQDLYLAGYENNRATSIHVIGDLTGDTIWVWPEKVPHRLSGEQFAVLDEASVNEESLYKFRNALPDGTEGTGCTNGEYLAGVRHANDTNNVYWNKFYSVSFKKKDNKGAAVVGAGFTLYKDKECTDPFRTSVSADGENDSNDQGEILETGTVDFSAVPIGVYYMKETSVPNSYRGSDTTYILLVGSPSLSPDGTGHDPIWNDGGPLDIGGNTVTLVHRYTVDSGKYYGIYPLGSNGKADVSKNLASNNVGIINIRNDYDAWFMKTDGPGGNPLPNAEFTIFKPKLNSSNEPELNEYDYPKMARWSREGEEPPDPVKSADGTSKFKSLDGKTLDKGLVYFRELPIGTYYIVETWYPDRDGSNHKSYFVENDRVFKLEIKGVLPDNKDVTDFTLSEWNAADKEFHVCEKVEKAKSDNYFLKKNQEYYPVENQVAVCKLTTGDGRNLLYEKGKVSLSEDGEPEYHPAIYSTLEEGFEAAQNNVLYNKDKEVVADDDKNPALKLQMLRDFSLTQPLTYTGTRDLTLTTASKTAATNDRYTFNTMRTSDTSRAEVKRAYDSDGDKGALITVDVDDGKKLTLQNVNLNGNRSSHHGRAIYVEKGSITIKEHTLVQNFKEVAAEDSEGSNDVKGGAILMNDNTTLTIDGSASGRSAIFSGNQAVNYRTDGAAGADGGAISVGSGCTVSIKSAQFLNNIVSTAVEEAGTGGAVCFNTNDNDNQSAVSLNEVVFRDNEAGYHGGALYLEKNWKPTLDNNIFTGNTAVEGSAVYVCNVAEATFTGSSITDNTTSGVNGGAINVGGGDARLYFGGRMTVFDNVSPGNKSQQKNVVLSVDSNHVINTTENGLTGGTIGVYFVETDNLGNKVFEKHGLPEKPFGTFKDDKRVNPQVFRNDHCLALYGVRNEDDTDDHKIYWVEIICKLTDTDDNILYQDISFTLDTKKKTYTAPAVYSRITKPDSNQETSIKNGFNTLRDGFDAAEDKIYVKSDTNSKGYDEYKGQTIKLKMLQDVALDKSIQYKGNRNIIFTTAELEKDMPADMRTTGDFFWYEPGHNDENGNLDSTAQIIRAYNGDSMIASQGKNLTLTDIILDGNSKADKNNLANKDGGIVNVKKNSHLTITDGAVLRNSKTTQYGGAVYVAQGAKLYLSGNPDFGGSGVNEDGSINPEYGNFSVKENVLAADAKNGSQTYTSARQDIYIDGYNKDDDTDTSADSLIVNGDITSGDGTIWVWAEKSPRYKTLCQFAKYVDGENGVKNIENSLKAFRNARADSDTGADHVGQYLYGVTKDDDTGKNVFWYGVEGFRRVILRKVGKKSGSENYQSLSGGQFIVYNVPNPTDTTLPAKDKEGNYLGTAENPLTAGAGGAFFVGELNFGTYYVKEVQPPAGYNTPAANHYFIITVDEDGVAYKYKDAEGHDKSTREVEAELPSP